MTAVHTPDSISILGTQVSVFRSYDHALQLIQRRIVSRLAPVLVAIKPEKISRGRRRKDQRERRRSAVRRHGLTPPGILDRRADDALANQVLHGNRRNAGRA